MISETDAAVLSGVLPLGWAALLRVTGWSPLRLGLALDACARREIDGEWWHVGRKRRQWQQPELKPVRGAWPAVASRIEARRARVRELHAVGWTDERMAKELACSHSVIKLDRRALKLNANAAERPRRKFSYGRGRPSTAVLPDIAKRRQQVQEMTQRGLSATAISQQLGIGRSVVYADRAASRKVRQAG